MIYRPEESRNVAVRNATYKILFILENIYYEYMYRSFTLYIYVEYLCEPPINVKLSKNICVEYMLCIYLLYFSSEFF